MTWSIIPSTWAQLNIYPAVVNSHQSYVRSFTAVTFAKSYSVQQLQENAFFFLFFKNKNIYDLFLKIYVLSRNCLRTNSETNMSKYTIHVLAPIKHLEHEIYLTALKNCCFYL